MMKRNLIILWAFLIASLYGCYKDKGHYDLQAINEISIGANISDTIEIVQFDTLRIIGQLEQTIPVPEDQLNYRWTAYTYPSGGYEVVLGDEKDLAVPIGLSPGKYNVLYRVTDPETDVSTFREFYMEVTGILSEGWLALENKPDGTQDVAIINSSGIIRDIYGAANPVRVLPEASFAIKVLNSFYAEQNIFILSENDGVQVDYVSFQAIGSFADWFVTPPKQVKVENYFYTKAGAEAFFINNGDFYSFPFFYQGTRLFGAPILGDWKISKIPFPLNSTGAILYDTKNQRFVKYSSNKITTFSEQEGMPFIMNDIGKELVYGGASSGNYYNCLMKSNDADQYFVYRINTSGSVPAAGMYEVLDAPELAQAKFFASSGLYLHIYYAVNNKIYLLDIPAQKARLVYSFPADAEITAFELKQSQGSRPVYPDNNKTLCVATYQNNQGSIYTFSIDNTGDFMENTYYEKYAGFGKVIDLEYKFKK